MTRKRIARTALIGLTGLLIDQLLQAFWGIHVELLRDLAIAFVAAAIVGFGFETREFDRKLLEIIAQLRQTWRGEALDRYRAVISGLYNVGDLEKEDRFALQQVKLRDALITLVEATTKMSQTQLADRALSFEVVTRLLNYSSVAAHEMWMAQSGGGEHDVRLPFSARELADEILAEQMRFMRPGDTYLVISDFSSWFPTERLNLFWTASYEAMKRHKVRIRRVFRHCEADRELLPIQAEEVLRVHWDRAQARELQHKGRPLYDVAVSLDTTSGYQHQGIFVCRSQRIRFSPKDGTDLAWLKFSMNAETYEFDQCWTDALPAFRSNGTGGVDFVPWATVKDAINAEHARWWSNFDGVRRHATMTKTRSLAENA